MTALTIKAFEAFLLKNHKEENIVTFKSNYSNWDWARTIKASKVASRDGLLIFVGKNNKVLYIGQTEFISTYVTGIKHQFDLHPTRIYVIHNENPSSKMMTTNAYRAKFNPLHNSRSNGRFLFDGGKTVLNLSPKYEKMVGWITRNGNARFVDFTDLYSYADLKGLCKCFSLIRTSYKDLKLAIKANTKEIKVLNRSL